MTICRWPPTPSAKRPILRDKSKGEGAALPASFRALSWHPECWQLRENPDKLPLGYRNAHPKVPGGQLPRL
jgi:hypothetical protein